MVAKFHTREIDSVFTTVHITVTHSDSEVLAHTYVMWCMTSAV